MQESIVHFHLARQSPGSCSFVLRNNYYQDWSQSRRSKILGLVGASGSGKTAVSVFIFNKIQSLAPEGTPVLFLNCMPGTNDSRMKLLQYMIWQILEQRPDILFRNIRNKGYYMRLFREATTFDALWLIFMQIIRALEELWIVLDSIHDCPDGKEFINDLMALVKTGGLRTRIKLAISSRNVSDVETISDGVMQYSAEDMQEGNLEYISHEASLMGERGSFLLNLAPEINASIARIGGVAALRRPIVHLVLTTHSDDEARQLLSQITNIDSLADCLWKNINRHAEPRRSLIVAITRMLVDTGGQFTVMQIYNALRASEPQLLEGVNIASIGDLVKDELSAYASLGHGFFLIDNVVRQHFQWYFAEPEEQPEYLHMISPSKEQEILIAPCVPQNPPWQRVTASRLFPALCLALLL